VALKVVNDWIITIIITKTTFLVLSSLQSNCESSPGSFDECRTAPSGRRPKTKPDDLGCESACTVMWCYPRQTMSLCVHLCRIDKADTLTITFDEWREFLLLHPSSSIHDIVHYWRHATVCIFLSFFSFFPYGAGSISCLVLRPLNRPSERPQDNIQYTPYIKGRVNNP